MNESIFFCRSCENDHVSPDGNEDCPMLALEAAFTKARHAAEELEPFLLITSESPYKFSLELNRAAAIGYEVEHFSTAAYTPDNGPDSGETVSYSALAKKARYDLHAHSMAMRKLQEAEQALRQAVAQDRQRVEEARQRGSQEQTAATGRRKQWGEFLQQEILPAYDAWCLMDRVIRQEAELAGVAEDRHSISPPDLAGLIDLEAMQEALDQVPHWGDEPPEPTASVLSKYFDQLAAELAGVMPEGEKEKIRDLLRSGAAPKEQPAEG